MTILHSNSEKLGIGESPYGPRKMTKLEMMGIRFDIDPENPTGEGASGDKPEDKPEPTGEPDSKTPPAGDSDKGDTKDDTTKDDKGDKSEKDSKDEPNKDKDPDEITDDEDPITNMQGLRKALSRNKNLMTRLKKSEAENAALKEQLSKGLSEADLAELTSLREDKSTAAKKAALKEAQLPEDFAQFLGDSEDSWEETIKTLSKNQPSPRLGDDNLNNGNGPKPSGGGQSYRDISRKIRRA